MRNTEGVSKTEQAARLSLEQGILISTDTLVAHFGWESSDAKRRIQDILRSARYTATKSYAQVRKGPRAYKVLYIQVLAIADDPKARVPVVAVARDKDGNIIDVKHFRSGYVTSEHGFDHASVIAAAKGQKRNHMHAGHAWRYACDDKHALATIAHIAKWGFICEQFKGVEL